MRQFVSSVCVSCVSQFWYRSNTLSKEKHLLVLLFPFLRCSELFTVKPMRNSYTRRSCLIKSLEFLILLFLIKYSRILGYELTVKNNVIFYNLVIRGNFPSKTFQGLTNITYNDQKFRLSWAETQGGYDDSECYNLIQ